MFWRRREEAMVEAVWIKHCYPLFVSLSFSVYIHSDRKVFACDGIRNGNGFDDEIVIGNEEETRVEFNRRDLKGTKSRCKIVSKSMVFGAICMDNCEETLLTFFFFFSRLPSDGSSASTLSPSVFRLFFRVCLPSLAEILLSPLFFSYFLCGEW